MEKNHVENRSQCHWQWCKAENKEELNGTDSFSTFWLVEEKEMLLYTVVFPAVLPLADLRAELLSTSSTNKDFRLQGSGSLIKVMPATCTGAEGWAEGGGLGSCAAWLGGELVGAARWAGSGWGGVYSADSALHSSVVCSGV